MAGRLWVYLSDHRAGHMDHDQGRFSFRYDSGADRPISVRLPVREEPYGDAECRPFFTNLLPEGNWRMALCRQMKIAPENDFALLEAIGQDCAGAIALHTESDWKPRRGDYRKTTVAELRRWVKNPAARPAITATPGLRLSLAGAQDKLLIHLDGETPYLCEGGAASTVILKPDIHDPFNRIDFSGLNELLSMRLAAQAGIQVPETRWFASAFAVRRYDRAPGNGPWRRLHQEDFAQILGVSAALKYDVQWKPCFDLVATWVDTPALARIELIERLFFNLAIGNNDAHGKNFALLHHADGSVKLSPAYDLLSTQVYPSLQRTFAMKIGSADRIEQLDNDHWKAFAGEVGVRLPFLRERGARIVDAVKAGLASSLDEVEEANPSLGKDLYPATRRRRFFGIFSKVIKQNCGRIMRSLAK